jgi:hypothetical protein
LSLPSKSSKRLGRKVNKKGAQLKKLVWSLVKLRNDFLKTLKELHEIYDNNNVHLDLEKEYMLKIIEAAKKFSAAGKLN